MEIGECVICSNEFEALSQVSPILLSCGHIVCISCKENWFDKDSSLDCPECGVEKTLTTRSFIELETSFLIIDKLCQKYSGDTDLMERINKYKEVVIRNNKPNIRNQLREKKRRLRAELLNNIEHRKHKHDVSEYGSGVLQFNNHCKTSNIAYTDGLFHRCILFIPNMDINTKHTTAPFLVFNCCHPGIVAINLSTEEQTYIDIDNIDKQITHCDVNDFEDGLILCSNYTKCVYIYDYKTGGLIYKVEHNNKVKMSVFDKELKNQFYILDTEDCVHMGHITTHKLEQDSCTVLNKYKGMDSIETITPVGKNLLLVQSKQHLVILKFVEQEEIRVFDLEILFEGLEDKLCISDIDKEVNLKSRTEIKKINFDTYKYKVVQRLDKIYIGVLRQKASNSNSIHTRIFELLNEKDNGVLNFKCELSSEKVLNVANNWYCFIPIRVGMQWYIPVRSKIDNMMTLLDLEDERFLYMDIKVEGVCWDVDLIYKKEGLEFMAVKFKDKTVFVAMGTGEEFRTGNNYMGPITCSSTMDSDDDNYSYNNYYYDCIV
eukprot:GAHX01000763.1.p1 GENE.GAHX01000763.1~~GAHX01000763.1.p1  ORF type:complete len:546 (+),score=111.36 GAHX01000763.1:49-1686(+)